MPNFGPLMPALVTGVLGLLGVIVAAWLAARFTAGRFFTERTWERKANAYSTVFEGLHAMLIWTSEHLDAEMEGRELSAAKSNELEAEYQEAKKRIRKEIAAATWLLKPEVEEEMDALWAGLRKRRDSWFEVLDDTYGALANTQTKLRMIAREDLGLVRPKRYWRQRKAG